MILDRPTTWKAQVGLLVALTLVVAVRYWYELVPAVVLGDEVTYMRSVDLVLADQSPYTRGHYLYPPFLAVAGAQLVEMLGAPAFLRLLRSLCYVGMALTVWFAMISVPWRRWFVPAAVAYLCVAPAVMFTMDIHNISPLVAGAALAALWSWPRRPLLAGCVLGFCAVLKPMVALLPALLFFHRPRRGGRVHLVAGAVSGVVAGALLWFPPYLEEMFALASKAVTIPRSVSLHRLGYLAGWDQGALWISGGIALVALWLVRRRELGRLEILAISVIATLMATPVLWNHTLLLSLPVQAMALERLYRRRLEGETRSLETVFVLLTVLALQLSGGASGVDDQPLALQVWATLPIALAPFAVVAYVMGTGGYRESDASPSAS